MKTLPMCICILLLFVGSLSYYTYKQDLQIRTLQTLSAEQDVRLIQQQLALEIMLEWLLLISEEVDDAMRILEERQDVPEDREQTPDGMQLREIPHGGDYI